MNKSRNRLSIPNLLTVWWTRYSMLIWLRNEKYNKMLNSALFTLGPGWADFPTPFFSFHCSPSSQQICIFKWSTYIMAVIESYIYMFLGPMLQRKGYVTTKIKSRKSTVWVVSNILMIPLIFFKIMYEVSIFFAAFPGTFFHSPGISEIFSNLHTLVKHRVLKQSTTFSWPNKTERHKHSICRLCPDWALSVNIDYYNLVFALHTQLLAVIVFRAPSVAVVI